MRVRVLDLALTGQVPDGTVEVTLDALDREALGTMTLVPPAVDHLLSLGFQLTITRPAERTEPLVLTTKAPARLTSQITSFPPVNQPYTLTDPVPLVDPAGQDTAVVEKFPVALTAV